MRVDLLNFICFFLGWLLSQFIGINGGIDSDGIGGSLGDLVVTVGFDDVAGW